MKHKILIITLLIFSLGYHLLGQNKNDSLNNPNYCSKFSIGIGSAYTIGYNEELFLGPYAEGYTLEYSLAFRYTPNKFGIQTSIAPFYTKNITQFVGGVNFIFSLLKVEHINLYLYQGNYFSYTDRNYVPPHYLSRYNGTYKYFNNGFGLGIEIIQNEIMGLNLMFGYSFYKNFAAFRRKGELMFFYKF